MAAAGVLYKDFMKIVIKEENEEEKEEEEHEEFKLGIITTIFVIIFMLVVLFKGDPDIYDYLSKLFIVLIGI